MLSLAILARQRRVEPVAGVVDRARLSFGP
jgi:hypothetical protein